jgi:3D (Asp-Asp-Asp) domain-containing protein
VEGVPTKPVASGVPRFVSSEVAIETVEVDELELPEWKQNIEVEPEPVYGWVSLGEFTLTAYCACEKCCGKSDGITATGTVATAGRTIAVDPTVIPYGSRIQIYGNTYIAEDCGGAIKQNKIDVYFDTHEEALEFGRRSAEVFIWRG